MKRWGFLLTMSLREYCLVSREQRLHAQLETRNVPTIHSTKLQTEPMWIVQSEVFFLSFCFLSLTLSTYSLWYRGLILHIITHMDTLGMMTPLDEGSARHRKVWRHNTHKRQDIHASPYTEFEPATPVIQRSQTRVFECAATGIAGKYSWVRKCWT